MNISEADSCALRSRFRHVFIDEKIIIHNLPNGLIILTFNPNYIRECSTIEMSPIKISDEIVPNTAICKTDKDIINAPVGGSIIDVNKDADKEIQLFQTGLTSSFLLIMKPIEFRESLPQSFLQLF